MPSHIKIKKIRVKSLTEQVLQPTWFLDTKIQNKLFNTEDHLLEIKVFIYLIHHVSLQYLLSRKQMACE